MACQGMEPPYSLAGANTWACKRPCSKSCARSSGKHVDSQRPRKEFVRVLDEERDLGVSRIAFQPALPSGIPARTSKSAGSRADRATTALAAWTLAPRHCRRRVCILLDLLLVMNSRLHPRPLTTMRSTEAPMDFEYTNRPSSNTPPAWSTPQKRAYHTILLFTLDHLF